MDDTDEQMEGTSVYDNMVAKKKESHWRLFSWRRKSAASTGSKSAGGAGQSAKLQWSNHLTIIKALMKGTKGGQETLQKVAVLSAKNTTLKDNALSSIPDVGQVHTVDLEACRLREVPPYLDNVDTLVILRLLNNSIRRIPKELGHCLKLETIHLGWNHISYLDPEIFSEQSFPLLEVINLRHNKLVILPINFGTTCRPCRIKHIDLAENNIVSLPDTLSNCKHLQFFDISKNKISELPKSFQFPKLTKLFMSFNQIVELPDSIGDCVSLQSIRMTHNLVRRLPDNMLNLRHTLQEFQVDMNPLVVPSITAFEMGGLEQAFKLLEEHVRNAERAAAMPALMPPAKVPALENKVAGQLIALDMEANTWLEGGKEQSPHANQSLDYYFSHCKSEEEITEIRRAESTLLIIKKNLYFQSQVALAKAARDGPGGDSAVPNNLKKFLDPSFDVSKWHGVSRVTDLDLYFNLLVYSTKPLFSSCYTLFDKFETEDKGYLNKDEWNEFLTCSPVLLEDAKIHEGMWQLMAWQFSDRITLPDFVAAWHIHDVEHIDPQIQRSASVLRLDYYDMSILELQNRLRSKDAQDATPTLDFDQDSDEEHVPEDSQIRLERVEGERWVTPASNTKNGGKQKGNARDDRPTAHKEIKNLSMTDAEFAEYDAHHGDNVSDGDQSDISLQSDQLSDSSVEALHSSDRYDFCVDDHWMKMGASSSGNGPAGELQVNSDDALRSLMDMDPANFFKKMTKKKGNDADAKALLPRKETPKGRKAKAHTQDSRFKTDVYPVRQEIRHVFRNLPYDDFVKLINFLLRGMQMIKHNRRGATYWHVDDPTFKFSMGVFGSNLYTRRLLLNMGFALLDNLYWVWPVVHMQEVSRLASSGVPVWGDEEIPRTCPGRNADRLDDMITLLRNCQKRLHKLGKAFNGNFS